MPTSQLVGLDAQSWNSINHNVADRSLGRIMPKATSYSVHPLLFMVLFFFLLCFLHHFCLFFSFVAVPHFSVHVCASTHSGTGRSNCEEETTGNYHHHHTRYDTRQEERTEKTQRKERRRGHHTYNTNKLFYHHGECWKDSVTPSGIFLC